jgi:hypothetical protein
MKNFYQKILAGIIVVTATLAVMIYIPQTVLAEKTISSVNVESSQVGTTQDTVIVSGETTPSPGEKTRIVPERKKEVEPKYELKPSSTPQVIVKPKIEAVLPHPCCALNPGTTLYLKGSFGIKPGKILMCGNFPGTCVELEKIIWESSSKVNGFVPLYLQGLPNQPVEIMVLAAPPPNLNYSNTWKMNFIGRPYCGKSNDKHIIYTIDGKVGRDCTPYVCIEDQVGAYCLESCGGTGDCASGYICDRSKPPGKYCVVPPK